MLTRRTPLKRTGRLPAKRATARRSRFDNCSSCLLRAGQHCTHRLRGGA